MHKETHIGYVHQVNGNQVSFSLSNDSFSGFIYISGQGYRVGQIGGFVKIPIGFLNLYGIISQVGSSLTPKSVISESSDCSRWMTVQLFGESYRNGLFRRGISQYPTIGDEVHLVIENDLRLIYSNPDKPYYVKIGHISNAESISALLDINKLITRHSAVVGATGSGKSTTVAAILDSISNKVNYPSARIIVLDIHGEYGSALRDKANVYRIGARSTEAYTENELFIPFWGLTFDELCDVSFGRIDDDKTKNMIMEKIIESKKQSLDAHPRAGIANDSVNVDSPIPFSLSKLWYQLYTDTYSTYYRSNGGNPKDNLAYEKDINGNDMVGNHSLGIAPTFKKPKDVKEDPEKINYTPSPYGSGNHLQLLGSKLRIPRYDFIFRPGAWNPCDDGNVDEDIDELLKGWIGSDKPLTIFDLSGVPTDILNTIVGVLFRIVYEALFWGRNLSQGGRFRPLLIVMEEAHLYLNDNSSASTMVQRIVKEGRKYGIGAMIVSQRPSEINSTILSQCGTMIAMRLSNSVDRGHVTGIIPDSLSSLTDMLPVLRIGEAIIVGESVKLPMRTIIEPPIKERRPDSQDPIIYDTVQEEDSMFVGGWGIPMEDDPKYDEIVETWRSKNPMINRVQK